MRRSLSDWHRQLEERFRSLRTERDKRRPDSSLFALEHDLDLNSEWPALAAAVRESVTSERLPRNDWLPFVVYAAEIGYRYRGDEYWPVFNAETPGWQELGNSGRIYIRRKYEQFAEGYGGAVPSGRWAEWFKNIAWPIVHAILPADLQRHLARLLYDYRTALTSKLLNDHQALGERLARRSENTSARFKKFAENTSLLGLVSASLLLGEEEETTLLCKSTLHRIVVDLSGERQAGSWLLDARGAAVKVRRRGLLPSVEREQETLRRPEADDCHWPALELELLVRLGTRGWAAYVTIPSHASLAERFPDLRTELERLRFRLVGVDGVQPRGALMYRRGPIALSAFPEVGASMLVPEGASEAACKLLIDSCRVSGGPWLFHLREAGLGSEVHTRLVRPGNQYLLLRDPSDPEVGFSEKIAFRTSGVAAYRVQVPTQVDERTIAELRRLGLGVVSDVRVWPAGHVPAAWDGEGRAAWRSGVDPIIGIRSTRSPSTCIVSTETCLLELPWPPESENLFFKLTDLEVGVHTVEVVLRADDRERILAQGNLEIRLLDPADSSSVAGGRQGLSVISYPAHPTLDELWAGTAAIVADGPHGERVQFRVDLTTLGGRTTLASAIFSSSLPVDQQRWWELFRGAQGSSALSLFHGDAEEIVVTATNPTLGATRIRAERPFAPMRWNAGQDRSGPYARLVNHTDNEDLSIDYYDALHPGERDEPTLDSEGRVRSENGGLVVARTADYGIGIVLPPTISGGLEALARLSAQPSLQTGARSADSVRRMLRLARLWTHCAIPANVYAERIQDSINDVIVARLSGMVGGGRWSDVEDRALIGENSSLDQLLDAIGRSSTDRSAALELYRAAATLTAREASVVVPVFFDVVRCRFPSIPATDAERLLQLTTAPGVIRVEESESLDQLISVLLEKPVLLRLARFFVLALGAKQPSSTSTRRLWSWQ